MKADLFPGDEKYKKRMEVENAHMDDTALRLSVFGQRCFYNAFAEFDDQDIEMSLKNQIRFRSFLQFVQKQKDCYNFQFTNFMLSTYRHPS